MYEVSDDDEYEIVNSPDNELELLDLGTLLAHST
jgi:hypothetical protein